MSDSETPDGLKAISAAFFEWIEKGNDDIFLSLIDLSVYIEEQNLRGVFDVLDIVQSRILRMRHVSIIFDGYLDKHKQLMMSIQPKEEQHDK